MRIHFGQEGYVEKIQELMHMGSDFAFETTLSTRSYKNLVEQA